MPSSLKKLDSSPLLIGSRVWRVWPARRSATDSRKSPSDWAEPSNESSLLMIQWELTPLYPMGACFSLSNESSLLMIKWKIIFYYPMRARFSWSNENLLLLIKWELASHYLMRTCFSWTNESLFLMIQGELSSYDHLRAKTCFSSSWKCSLSSSTTSSYFSSNKCWLLITQYELTTHHPRLDRSTSSPLLRIT